LEPIGYENYFFSYEKWNVEPIFTFFSHIFLLYYIFNDNGMQVLNFYKTKMNFLSFLFTKKINFRIMSKFDECAW